MRPYLTDAEISERERQDERRRRERFQDALTKIAAGRREGREPITAEKARRIAQDALR